MAKEANPHPPWVGAQVDPTTIKKRKIKWFCALMNWQVGLQKKDLKNKNKEKKKLKKGSPTGKPPLPHFLGGLCGADKKLLVYDVCGLVWIS